MQHLCWVRSLISIIMRLWLLCLSLRYTSFQHFNVSVREICHCVHRQNGVMFTEALFLTEALIFPSLILKRCKRMPKYIRKLQKYNHLHLFF